MKKIIWLTLTWALIGWTLYKYSKRKEKNKLNLIKNKLAEKYKELWDYSTSNYVVWFKAWLYHSYDVVSSYLEDTNKDT